MWNVCPDIILEGYVYAGVPPLYKITMAGKYYYLKNDAALEEFRQKNVGKKYTVNRLKGLNCNGRGTSCPDQLAIAITKAIEE